MTTDALFRLDGQTAIVTGAGQHIGRGIAAMLGAAGAAVVVVDLNAETAQATADVIAAAGGRAVACVADVTDEAQTAQPFELAMERFGRLDVLVNNAGVYPFSPLMELTRETYDRTLDTNLRGPVLYMREAARRMTPGGRIINISSIDSLRPTMAGLGHYGASKAALNAFTRAGAVDFAPLGLRVNAVLPGVVGGPGSPEAFREQWAARTPCRRVATPEDIGGAVLFLASGAATFVNGQTLVVDGGLTIAG